MLLLPPGITALWILSIRRTTDTEPELTWFWTYVAIVVIYMIPGLVGVTLGIVARNVLRRRF